MWALLVLALGEPSPKLTFRAADWAGSTPAVLTATCGGEPSVTRMKPHALAASPAAVTVELANVAHTCLNAHHGVPCVPHDLAYPDASQFYCTFVKGGESFVSGPVAATNVLIESHNLSLGFAAVVECPSPTVEYLSVLPASVNLTITYGRASASAGERLLLPYVGDPDFGALVWGGVESPPPPSPPLPTTPPPPPSPAPLSPPLSVASEEGMLVTDNEAHQFYFRCTAWEGAASQSACLNFQAKPVSTSSCSSVSGTPSSSRLTSAPRQSTALPCSARPSTACIILL